MSPQFLTNPLIPEPTVAAHAASKNYVDNASSDYNDGQFGVFYRETVPIREAGSNTGVAMTGRIAAYPIYLKAGDVISNLTFLSNAAATTPTHWWFALYDGSKNLLRQTADQTTTAWAAATAKKLALATTYTVPTSGIYYVVIHMAATTGVTLYGATAPGGGAWASVKTAHPTMKDLGMSGALAGTATAPATLGAASGQDSLVAYCLAT